MSSSEFQRALTLFHAEQLDAAVEACLPYVQQPMFKLLLATCYGKLSRYSDADRLFSELLQQYPTNVDVLFNFALVLKMQQQIETAEQYFHKCLHINPGYHPAWHALGGLAESRHDHHSAERHYERALSAQPSNKHYALSLARAAFNQQNYQQALSLLNAVLQTAFDASALDLVSAIFYKLKNVSAMRQLAHKYANELTKQPEALKYAGLLELDEKCFLKAYHLLRKAQEVSFKPSFDITANVLYCRYLLKPCRELLQQIVDLSASDNSDEAFYFVVNLLATLGELQQADEILQQALVRYPDSIQLQLLQSRLLIQLKRPQQSLAVLENIKDELDDETQLEVCYQKIQLFELSGDYALAAEQIKKAAGHHVGLQIVKNLQHEVARAKADLSAVDSVLPGHLRPLTFIIGFPRSGTTLLESRLAQYRNVKILEETNAVKQFYLHLSQLSGEEHVVSFLQRQSESNRQALANQYLASLADYAELNADDIIVDKMPLNALYLTPLLLLFPYAKVVLMQRHPMDVCISSLKQRMINLFTVDDFVQSYDAYFSLLDSFEQAFKNNVLVIKYEHLVSDYQTVFNQVLDHCGISAVTPQLTDSPAMFNTPSYHQVNQPLYQKAVNSYQHYQAFFDFNHPRMISWCEKLGY